MDAYFMRTDTIIEAIAEEKKCLNSELWHACAGPLVSLPLLGSRVVYFPQGHSEQVSNCIIISLIVEFFFCFLNGICRKQLFGLQFVEQGRLFVDLGT